MVPGQLQAAMFFLSMASVDSSRFATQQTRQRQIRTSSADSAMENITNSKPKGPKKKSSWSKLSKHVQTHDSGELALKKVEFPSFKNGKCSRFSQFKHKCTLEARISKGITRDIRYDQCGEQKNCVDLETDKAVPYVWMNGLWAKFLDIKNRWEVPLTDSVLDFYQLKAAINDMDQFRGPNGFMDGLNSWIDSKWQTGNNALLSSRRGSLLKRKQWAPYKDSPLKGKKFLIIGAGPIGLRMAIEMKLLGGEALVAEGRDDFVRCNVMKMWTVAKSDLESIGFDEFGVANNDGGMKVNIALMQHGLMRIAMSIGVEVRTNTQYTGMQRSSKGRWMATFQRRGGGSLSSLDFDAIFDGTGTRSIVGSTKLPKCDKKIVPQSFAEAKSGQKSRSHFELETLQRRHG